jgi:STE24 endopeptidase
MYNILFYIFIGLILFDYLFEKILDYLNLKHIFPELPAEVADVFDPETYSKSKEYKLTNTKFSFITSTFSLILVLAMIISGGFGYVNNISYSVFSNDITVALFFFAILFLASDLLTTPFSVYKVFVIEEKFGFNKTTRATYFFDKIKGWLIGGVIGGGLLALIIWFFQMTGEKFWVFAWIAISGFTILMTMFYSQLIVPLFNKQTPLEEGTLKESIKEMTSKTGFRLDNVYVIDGSKRSTKANAYFTGLGSRKRIVLYDTLINDLTSNEILAVLAHEIGHYKKKHSLYGTINGIIQAGITLFLFSLFINNQTLSEAMSVSKPNFHISLIAFGILFSPVSLVTGIISMIFSRKHEYEADRYAAENADAEALISALKKLSGKNLSNLTPHPAYVFFHYSHPTLVQRIRALNLLKSN